MPKIRYCCTNTGPSVFAEDGQQGPSTPRFVKVVSHLPAFPLNFFIDLCCITFLHPTFAIMIGCRPLFADIVRIR